MINHPATTVFKLEITLPDQPQQQIATIIAAARIEADAQLQQIQIQRAGLTVVHFPITHTTYAFTSPTLELHGILGGERYSCYCGQFAVSSEGDFPSHDVTFDSLIYPTSAILNSLNKRFYFGKMPGIGERVFSAFSKNTG